MLPLRYIAWLFFPLSVCIELLVLGLLVLWFGRRKTLGKGLVTVGTVLLAVFSCGPFGDLFVRPRESTHPPLLGPPAAGEGPVRWVVVLGAGYAPAADLPVTSRFSRAGLARVVEAARVRHSYLPGARVLLLVGGADAGDGRGEAAAELAAAVGLPPADVAVETGARDTAEEADVIRRRVGGERFVLVTSAAHMPRAVRLCEDRGLRPVPAPTDYQAAGSEYPVLHALPSPGNLNRTETGFYEALAGAWRAAGR